MSFMQRLKEGKIAPALQAKLQDKAATNGHGDVDTNGSHTSSPSDQTVTKASQDLPRIVIIGAGSRGQAYSRAIKSSGQAVIVSVCEPNDFVRQDFGKKYIWGTRAPASHEAFPSWTDFIAHETSQRAQNNLPTVDACIVAVQDSLHHPVILALIPLNIHILCEKPLATSLSDSISIYRSLLAQWSVTGCPTLFSICHVLRYSPHNMLLYDLVRRQRIVGDIVSIEHTEPVGWWHFTHSYVRGNWRRSDTAAPSLLTKSCHDIDFIMWLLCSPHADAKDQTPHLPARISSSGRLTQFRRARKPAAAGAATNCFSCPISDTCIHSAKNIYLTKHFDRGNLGWPVKIVVPEIEDLYRTHGKDAARQRLVTALSEDYDGGTPDAEVKARNWFGRCVWDADNDVCDDQTVTMEWDDDEGENRTAKSATLHMTAPTAAICERRGRIYGTTGELSYDSFTISVCDFSTGKSTTYTPERGSLGDGGGHGGGDEGLVGNFVDAVRACVSGGMGAVEAQRRYLGCGLEEVVRSHVAVWGAEEARVRRGVVEWREFWGREVEGWRGEDGVKG